MSRKRLLEDLEIENYELENKKLILEMIKIEVETEKIEENMDFNDLKKVLMKFPINQQSSRPRNVNLLQQFMPEIWFPNEINVYVMWTANNQAR